MADNSHTLQPGVSIAGYQIVRVLGKGGFGITYEAYSPFTGKRVAIKEFFPRQVASREGDTRVVYSEKDLEIVQWALKRFESSTLDHCKLKHPNIVDVIHYVKDNNTGYMIMEYVGGLTLDDWLRGREFLPTPEELEPVISPVLSALEYLHARNMIHRDIAPDNIMIREDGTPMVIDFGAIKLFRRDTDQDAQDDNYYTYAVMKEFYSPPEQIRQDAKPDHRADIYSIGAVLYRAFSGQRPVTAADRMNDLAFGKADPYVPLADIASHVTPQVASAVDRALSFNADERHAEVADLRAELDWPDEGGVPTFVIPRDDEPEFVRRRSILPWLLPLIGIAVIGVAVAYVNGFIALPKSGTEIVKTPDPAPKLDEVKEVPQVPVHTQPNTNVPNQTTADGYMVVVASHKTEQEAQTALANLKAQLPSLFADHDAEVIGVNVGASDAFCRAMVGPLTKEDADALCQEFKRNKVACLVRMDN
jgi:serine/threonine protein kinase